MRPETRGRNAEWLMEGDETNNHGINGSAGDLHVQIAHFQRVVFDVLPARFGFFAH